MAGSLNTNFTNRKNLISIGESHNVGLYTDRPIDASADDPDGAAAREKVNRTISNPWIDDRTVVYSAPGSGDFNPENMEV